MRMMKGLCVSKGNAKGVVHLVTTDFQSDNLAVNTILVMKHLERDVLVNLSNNVVGVIAEVGNIGSHGAGILRQLGIPCMLRVQEATELLNDGDIVELRGDENRVLCIKNAMKIKFSQENKEEIKKINYKEISKERFELKDIRTIDKWYKPRPDRKYQKLRYDIISEVYTAGVEYLYKISTKTRQADDGTLEIYGAPVIEDMCSFELCNPKWFVEKANERTTQFSIIKNEMYSLVELCDEKDIDNVVYVFEKSIELYRDLFKYMFLTQLNSDEFVELYLDFITYVTGKNVSNDILNLQSDYVNNCIKSSVDPGVFQKWQESSHKPYIWEGEIDYSPFPIDREVDNCISGMQKNVEQLRKDYNAFRIIIPLIYQLSEEFFYMSRSINTFVNWSMVEIYKLIGEKEENLSIEEFFETPLSVVNQYVNKLKEED